MHINASGGLLVSGDAKRKVKLIFEDTKNDPAEAVNALRRLVTIKGTVAIIGPNTSRNAIAAASVAESIPIPMISPGSTHHKTTQNNNFVFRISYTDNQQGTYLSSFVIEKLAFDSAAILFDISRPSSRSVAESFKKAFEGKGGGIIKYLPYVTGETHFKMLITKALSDSPQIIRLPNPSSDAISQVEIARELSSSIVLLGSDNWGSRVFDQNANFEGHFYSDHWHPSIAEYDTQNKIFVRQYEAEFGVIPESVSALTYDALSVLFSAIESSGTESHTLRDAIIATDLTNGITGRITFNDGGDPEKKPMILMVQNQQSQVYRWDSKNRGNAVISNSIDSHP
ncbi:MAG: branched-chain amino acid transport system substrate-binding protein [Candidatus Azotimanducaceae bacterium]|jgi:branched-chain amino acid transport system substrate-binding protein